MDDRVCETKSAATERINLPKIAGLRFLQGALIGLGAVLPGISGGVLCVVFGVYKTVMELFSHPVRTLRKRYHILIPLILGGSFGFVVVARMLGFLLEKYPDPSVCLFVGLIAGMLPSLFREAGIKGRSKGSFISLAVFFIWTQERRSCVSCQYRIRRNIHALHLIMSVHISQTYRCKNIQLFIDQYISIQ